MNFLDRLQRTIHSATEEWNKPESFAKGEAFESYVKQHLFPQSDYELLYQTSSYKDNKQGYATMSLLPDFKYLCKRTGRQFYVEAKFRSGYHWVNNKLEWTYPEQLARYKQAAAQDAPVFIALGLGDHGAHPEFLFLIPLSKVNYCGFYESFLARYEFCFGRSVLSSYLWNL